MNHRLSRHFTTLVVSTISMTLAISASAQYKIERVENPQILSQTSAIPESPNGIYIVEMKGDPVVAYDGSIKKLKATKPAKGQKIDPNSQDVKKSNFVMLQDDCGEKGQQK